MNAAGYNPDHIRQLAGYLTALRTTQPAPTARGTAPTPAAATVTRHTYQSTNQAGPGEDTRPVAVQPMPHQQAIGEDTTCALTRAAVTKILDRGKGEEPGFFHQLVAERGWDPMAARKELWDRAGHDGHWTDPEYDPEFDGGDPA